MSEDIGIAQGLAFIYLTLLQCCGQQADRVATKGITAAHRGFEILIDFFTQTHRRLLDFAGGRNRLTPEKTKGCEAFARTLTTNRKAGQYSFGGNNCERRRLCVRFTAAARLRLRSEVGFS